MHIVLHNPIDSKNNHSNKFTWNGEEKMFVGEISENKEIGERPFGIKNTKTGKIVMFGYDHIVYHGSGEDKEIGAWVYVSLDKNVKCEVHLLND